MKELFFVLAVIIIWFSGFFHGHDKGKEYVYKEAIRNGAGNYVINVNKEIDFKWNCEK